MNWLFRPSILILLSVALTLGAAVLVLWQRTPDPEAMPLAENDLEIVWLYSATSAATWERFVTAVNTAAERLRDDYPDLEVQVSDKTFPPQTAAVPELALVMRGGSTRLVFRWYKLTSDQTTERWVEKLVGGPRRPPLAIIGGSTSDPAIELAYSLNRTTAAHAEVSPPLLILTTATADRTQSGRQGEDDGVLGVPLNRIYQGRTVRFCFTNRQMAKAVTHFIWSQDELRPDTAPVYMVVWQDDAYSRDLTGQFSQILQQPARALAEGEWAWLAAGHAAAGGSLLGQLGICAGSLPGETRLVSEWIDYSVGPIDQPNRWEGPAIGRLTTARLQHPAQQRPLLVLPAAAQGPARRFLRGLVRASPVQARRFVVATGDGVSFNTVYRDRKVLWPIQDLPCDLVFFCHRNPAAAGAGFRAEQEVPLEQPERRGQGTPTTGTEDLLLFVDMIKALVHASYQEPGTALTGDELRRRMAEARWKDGVCFDPDGRPLFDDDGNRRTGTGEHVVWLHPCIQGEQVLAGATIRVWSWPTNGPADRGRWRLYRTLEVDHLK